MCDYADQVKALRADHERECNSCPYTYGSIHCLDLNQNAADAIDELLAAVPHWISVEERLPEPGERVLITNGCFTCEAYQLRKRWLRHGEEIGYLCPTHWMPLPAPPEEDESDG